MKCNHLNNDINGFSWTGRTRLSFTCKTRPGLCCCCCCPKSCACICVNVHDDDFANEEDVVCVGEANGIPFWSDAALSKDGNDGWEIDGTWGTTTGTWASKTAWQAVSRTKDANKESIDTTVSSSTIFWWDSFLEISLLLLYWRVSVLFVVLSKELFILDVWIESSEFSSIMFPLLLLLWWILLFDIFLLVDVSFSILRFLLYCAKTLKRVSES